MQPFFMALAQVVNVSEYAILVVLGYEGGVIVIC
jgi:hypothetical protein